MTMKGPILTAILALVSISSFADHKDGHPPPGGASSGLEARVAALEAQTDKMLIAFSSDQTAGQGGLLLGISNLSNSLDDVAVVSPIAGKVTGLTFSIGQNLGQGGAPISPGAEESVEVYVVAVPYDSSDYGSPKVTLASLQAFLDGVSAPTECSGHAIATDSTYVPVGTQIGLLTVLGEGTHAANCSEAGLLVDDGDLISIWVRPDGFTSFQPRVTLVLERD